MCIGDGATVHSKSSKQKNVTKLSTEAELVAPSNSATQGLHIRNFMREQGHDVGPLVIYQDNCETINRICLHLLLDVTTWTQEDKQQVFFVY